MKSVQTNYQRFARFFCVRKVSIPAYAGFLIPVQGKPAYAGRTGIFHPLPLLRQINSD
jgi:hypothetical protein